MRIRTQAEAQQRADQIEAFRAELKAIEQEQVVKLDSGQRTAILSYHQLLLHRLAAAFDIDATSRQKQLSLGMRITSFLGALGLAASVVFFYFQFWGGLTTKDQVLILVSMPFLGLLLTFAVVWLDKSGYFAKLFGMVSLVLFVLNLALLGRIYNLSPSPQPFLAWAAFALLAAYATQARLLLAMGILCFAGYLSAETATWNGCYWLSFGERPEHFLPAALLLFLISLIPHGRYAGFAVIYRVYGLLLFFLPVLVLSNWGVISYLDLPTERIEQLYQTAGFVVSALAIGLGIFVGWSEVVNTGNTFFTLFLYTKFYDWWWDWMPNYLFFLIIGLTAIGMLLVLKMIRRVSIRRKLETAA